MKSLRSVAVCGFTAVLLSGCTLFSRSDSSQSPTELEFPSRSLGDASHSDATQKSEGKVANPPVKTIRFDGREIVLGTAEMTPVATDKFCSELSMLLDQEKYLSASLLVSKNRDVAEQAIWERCTDPASERLVAYIAGILSREASTTISWDSLLSVWKAQPADRQLYHQARSDAIQRLKSDATSDQGWEQLRIVAERLNHPLVTVDALRLLGLRELVARRHDWAESLFLQSAEIAEQHGDSARAAELWLMAATTANRSERSVEAEKAWRKAVQKQLEYQSYAAARPLNVAFWTRVEEQRPTDVQWPPQLAAALSRFCHPVGCQISPDSPAEFVLWCAVAVEQYKNAQPQLALVNFKRAEKLASGEDAMWLRIAQSKCLAALGQGPAAAALLSGPAASKNPSIAAAATAAIGSAKLQSGAYQQGTQLINKALRDSAEADWPTRIHAEADLALAQLIIGDTDLGLEALHAAQQSYQRQGDFVSLLQSLENELRIVELEDRGEAVDNVQLRIREIERTIY